MLEILILTLVSITTVSFTIIVVRFLFRFFKYEMQINRLLIVAIGGIEFGILVDCFRISSFLFFGIIEPATDNFFFVIKFFLFWVGLAAMVRVVMILSRQSGHEVKYESILRYSILAGLGTFSLLNLFTHETTPLSGINSFSGAGSFYLYQINQGLFIAILIFSFPVLVLLAVQLNKILKEVRDKPLAKQTLLLGLLFVLLVGERYFNLGHYFIPLSLTTFLIELSIVTFVSVSALLVFFTNPDFLEALSTYFCVRSIYMIMKKGGQLLFGYDFQKEIQKNVLSPDQLLLGGFVYAVSRGLEMSIQPGATIDTIQVGDMNLIFKHSKYVIGLAFISEDIPLVHFNLLLLMQRFERTYEKELEMWTGDLSAFETDMPKQWIYELFRSEK